MAYQRYFEPIGDDREDLRAAHIAAHSFGSNGRTSDYLLHFRDPFADAREEAMERERRIRTNVEAMRIAQQARAARLAQG